MPVSDDRVKEVVEYAVLYGQAKALEAYNIPQETFNRYRRKYRQVYGDSADLIARVREKFSDAELNTLLDINMQKVPQSRGTITFDGDDFCFLAMSDTHIGSIFFQEERLLSAFEEGRKQGATHLLHGGDIMEGMSGRPGHIYELEKIGYSAQRDYAVELLKQWGKPMFFCLGNHDFWINTKAGSGVDVGEDIAHRIPGAMYLGVHEGVFNVNGVQFMLWHGEDGSSYATSYRVQKIIEAFSGGEKPGVLLTAHTHKMAYIFDRNVHAVSTGSIQAQSGFMRYKRLPAHVGFWILRGTIKDGEIKRFSPTWYPFYK